MTDRIKPRTDLDRFYERTTNDIQDLKERVRAMGKIENVGGFTPGSVLFAGSDGLANQDNANLFWDDTNNKLGIGTASPTAKFDVTGGYMRARDNGTNVAPTSGKGVEIVGTGNTGYIQCYNRDSSSWQTLVVAGDKVIFQAAGATQFYVDTSGRLIRDGGDYRFSGTGSGTATGIELGDQATGNRYCVLDMHGDDTYTDFGLRLIRNNTGANTSSSLQHRGTGGLLFQAIDAGNVEIYTNSIQRLVVDGNGYVTIASNGTNIAKFHNSGLYLGGHNTPSKLIELATDSAGKPTTNTWQIISDRDTKRNVTPYLVGMELVRRVEPVEFEYNGQKGTPEGERGVGVIAQDVDKFAPRMVKREKYQDKDGNEGERWEYQGNELQYAVVNSLKDFERRIEKLESKVGGEAKS